MLQVLENNNRMEDDSEDNENESCSWVETASFHKSRDNIAVTGTVNGEIFIWDIVHKVRT